MPLWTSCQKLGEPMDDDGDDAYGVHSYGRGSKIFIVTSAKPVRMIHRRHGVVWRGVYLGLGQRACGQRITISPLVGNASVAPRGLRS